ncbi:UTP-glucose-1-phosphate uridylyltransferase [Thermodesulfatator indicus DSM 15286]|uniref:UTP--glucose-1-phosphate uridylyltransferase n=1 Tax=Thermodesulfatator indicus (strain DSM 15286 / JCM 11887 / CIR29812) TaxID=667014 RepID=F8A9T3_THEID|nr:UTP--glucose-1-phosphate uridylyltransferase GalU [Thermodesulfatator indicus]AEH45988.1 UTP-glucose-1-phosphate uridylyltransferase [Thermodesulfatator indicus DSM 15286]
MSHSTIRKAVLPVAGLGTRFLPATKAIPKEMLTVVDRPTIQYIVEEAVNSGVKQVILVTSSGKSAIENHFDYSYELESYLEAKGKLKLLEEVRRVTNLIEDIISVRQKKPLGLGHAIYVTRHVVGREPFAVLLGDDLVDSEIPCLKQMIEIFGEFKGPVIAVQRVPKEEIFRYGIVAGEKVGDRIIRVREMKEKPEPGEIDSDLAIIGRYILIPEIYDYLARTKPGVGGEIQLTDALSALKDDYPVYAYEFEGTRYDAGDKFGFMQAVITFALKHPEIGEKVKQFLKEKINNL